MPEFRYTAEFPRIYTARSLHVEPGDVVEWDEAPADGQWEPVDPPRDADASTSGETAVSAHSDDALADEKQSDETGDAGAPKKTTRRAAPAQQTNEE